MLDRLNADDHSARGMKTLTNDKKMSRLSNAQWNNDSLTPAPVNLRVPRRKDDVLVPSENENAVYFASLAKSYGNCCQLFLTDAERRQWCDTDLPLLDTLRVFSCGSFAEAHGHSWERADLAEGVLIYCTGGKGNYRQDQQSWEIRAGDLLYCSPNTHHQYCADVAQPWTIHWMHLSGSLLADYEELLGFSAGCPVRHIGTHDAIISDFTNLLHEFSRQIAKYPTTRNSTDWFRIQSNAIAILARIAELPQNIADIAAAYGPIQKAIALMDASLDQSFDLPRFAAEAGCGRRHFIRQFSRVTGMTPGDWFSRRKMQRACSLLTMPNVQIKQIAHRLGYSDALYFSRVFRRITGLSPEKYRLKIVLENER